MKEYTNVNTKKQIELKVDEAFNSFLNGQELICKIINSSKCPSVIIDIVVSNSWHGQNFTFNLKRIIPVPNNYKATVGTYVLGKIELVDESLIFSPSIDLVVVSNQFELNNIKEIEVSEDVVKQLLKKKENWERIMEPYKEQIAQLKDDYKRRIIQADQHMDIRTEFLKVNHKRNTALIQVTSTLENGNIFVKSGALNSQEDYELNLEKLKEAVSQFIEDLLVDYDKSATLNCITLVSQKNFVRRILTEYDSNFNEYVSVIEFENDATEEDLADLFSSNMDFFQWSLGLRYNIVDNVVFFSRGKNE